jgi:2OG-Fe(II) oxygenase superfamily
MIQLTQTSVLSDPEDIPRLNAEFAATGCARLPGFLAPPILKHLLIWLEQAQFEERNEVGHGEVFGTTLFVPETDRSWFLLQFIMNKPALFDIVCRIGGCPRIGNFIGRLHRTTAASHQHIDWHHDAVEARTLGICINLSAEEYTGGVLQIRDADRQMRAEVSRAAAGDAFLFRIDADWQHRLTRVESGRRTVGVGWFRTEPEWRKQAWNTARSREILAGTAGKFN